MVRKSLTVPAAEANRRFSALLRAARDGAQITITSHGEPVAVIGPARADPAAAWRMNDLEAHWARIEPIVIGPWSRDDLYARGPG